MKSHFPPKPKDERETVLPAKRNTQSDPVESVKLSPAKKQVQKVADDEDDFVLPQSKKKEATPSKKLKTASGMGIPQNVTAIINVTMMELRTLNLLKNLVVVGVVVEEAEMLDPEGAPNCLAGVTFIIRGTLDSLEREETEDLIKCHGGFDKKPWWCYWICQQKKRMAFVTEDGLFDVIQASVHAKAPVQEAKKAEGDTCKASLPNKSPKRVPLKSIS